MIDKQQATGAVVLIVMILFITGVVMIADRISVKKATEHIVAEQTEAELADTRISYIVVLCAYDALDEFVGDEFASLVVTSILAKNLRFECPMLIDLRGKFYEVALNIASALILNITEERMKSMTKFVEHCFSFVGSQQRWLSSRWFGKVTYYSNNRSYALAILVSL